MNQATSRSHVANTPLRPVLFAGLLASVALVACQSKVASPTGTRASARDEGAAARVTTTPEDAIEVEEDPFGTKPDPVGLGPVAARVKLPVWRDSRFCYYDDDGWCLSQTGTPPVWDYSSKNGYYKTCVSGNKAGRCKEGVVAYCNCDTP